MGGFTVKGEVAVKRLKQSGDTPQKGGLAATVGTDNGGDFALGEFKGEVFDDGGFAVAEADVLYFEGAFGDFFHGILSSLRLFPGAS